MEGTYITFETARLAKAKEFGYDFGGTDYVKGFYFEEDEEGFIEREIEMQQEDARRGDYYIRTTQAILQQWLRERHELFVEVQVTASQDYAEFTWLIFGKHNNMIGNIKDCNGTLYVTYETALEEALQAALTLIK